MRLWSWMICVCVCLNGVQLSYAVHDHWRYFWFPWLGVVALVGFCQGAFALYKLAMSSRSGLAGKFPASRPEATPKS